MMLLVDTSVWSLAFHRKKSAVLNAEQQRLSATLTAAINDGRVAIIGPIRQELLSGIREEAQFEKLRRALAPFLDEVLDTSDYEEAARLYNQCRSHGVECGTVDILICAVAARRNWDVLTTDENITRTLRVVGHAKTRSKSHRGTV